MKGSEDDDSEEGQGTRCLCKLMINLFAFGHGNRRGQRDTQGTGTHSDRHTEGGRQSEQLIVLGLVNLIVPMIYRQIGQHSEEAHCPTEVGTQCRGP